MNAILGQVRLTEGKRSCATYKRSVQVTVVGAMPAISPDYGSNSKLILFICF